MGKETLNQTLNRLESEGLSPKDQRDLLRRSLRLMRDMPHEIADLVILELTTAEADELQKALRRKV